MRFLMKRSWTQRNTSTAASRTAAAETYTIHSRPLALGTRDDGIATGATMLAAIRSARKLGAASVTVAAPVAAPEAVARLDAEADHVVILERPSILFSVSEWYEDFSQLDDLDVWEAISSSLRRHPFRPPA